MKPIFWASSLVIAALFTSQSAALDEETKNQYIERIAQASMVPEHCPQYKLNSPLVGVFAYSMGFREPDEWRAALLPQQLKAALEAKELIDKHNAEIYCASANVIYVKDDGNGLLLPADQ